MVATKAHLLTRGFTEARLWTEHRNQRALQFYRADGWHPDGATRVRLYGGNQLTELRHSTVLATAPPSLSLKRIAVRPLRPDESATFLNIHGRSVHGLASSHYPTDVVGLWAASPTPEAIRRFEASAGNDVRLVAEIDGTVVGVGCVSLRNCEVAACYVAPEATRQGVGTALMREMERIACDAGLDHLTLMSSFNAEPFYASWGTKLWNGLNTCCAAIRRCRPSR